MKNDYNIHSSLSSVNDKEQARRELIAYIKSQKDYFELLTDATIQAAYKLAGLFAIDFVRELNDDDEIIRLLDIAGMLEMNPENSEELRVELKDRIKDL